MEKIIANFLWLINTYGEGGELETFEACSNDGFDLAGSTIDKIVKVGDNNVAFYYNENTGDYDTIRAFDEKDLKAFFDDLLAYIENEYNDAEWVRDYVFRSLNGIFEASDADNITDDILADVRQDIAECADKDFNTDDIDLALQRVLMKKMGYSV